METARCVGDPIQVGCSGRAPFTFEYTDGIYKRTLSMDENNGQISFNWTGYYNLLSVTDGNGCTSERMDGNSFRIEERPQAEFLPPITDRCQFPLTLPVSLTGTPPWTLSYRTNQGHIKRETIFGSTPHLITVDHPGEYTLLEACTQMCCTTEFANKTIDLPGPPTAEVTGGFYQGQDIVVSFSGSPPFTLHYTEDGKEIGVSTQMSSLHIKTQERVTYSFLRVEDSSGCVSSLTHLQSITPGARPSGELLCLNNGYFKPDETPFVEAYLTGFSFLQTYFTFFKLIFLPFCFTFSSLNFCFFFKLILLPLFRFPPSLFFASKL